LNEYIDISKEYSTPNSKIFVNGVLDKIIAELKRDNLIEKTGRGLKENRFSTLQLHIKKVEGFSFGFFLLQVWLKNKHIVT
jgi:hypothetical protein